MNDLYHKDDYCMNFSSKEIEQYLLQPLRNEANIVIKLVSGIKMDFYMGSEKIKCVFFDGPTENFSISFYGHQTSIFISDESSLPNRTFTFNEEFMFIDDNAKEHIVSSDTSGNVVYEGTLRDKSHKEILSLLVNFIVMLKNVKKIKVKETVVSKTGWQYPKCKYVISITNNTEKKYNISYANILFSVNENKLLL